MPSEHSSHLPPDFARHEGLELPPELADLAEQLAGDAARAQEQYPPPACKLAPSLSLAAESAAAQLPPATDHYKDTNVSSTAPHPRPPRRPATIVALAALLATAAGLVPCSLWLTQALRPASRVAQIDNQTAAPIEGSPAGEARIGRPPVIPAEASPARAAKTPAGMASELSAPELEGMLDLLDPQATAGASLSI